MLCVCMRVSGCRNACIWYIYVCVCVYVCVIASFQGTSFIKCAFRSNFNVGTLQFLVINSLLVLSIDKNCLYFTGMRYEKEKNCPKSGTDSMMILFSHLFLTVLPCRRHATLCCLLCRWCARPTACDSCVLSLYIFFFNAINRNNTRKTYLFV